MRSEDVISWVLKALIVPVGAYLFKLRDTVLGNEVKIKALELEVKELKDKREKDLIEYNTTLGNYKGMEAIVERKFTEFLRETTFQREEQRKERENKEDQQRRERERKDKELSDCFNSLNKTLGHIETELTHMRKDIDKLPQNR